MNSDVIYKIVMNSDVTIIWERKRRFLSRGAKISWKVSKIPGGSQHLITCLSSPEKFHILLNYYQIRKETCHCLVRKQIQIFLEIELVHSNMKNQNQIQNHTQLKL